MTAGTQIEGSIRGAAHQSDDQKSELDCQQSITDVRYTDTSTHTPRRPRWVSRRAEAAAAAGSKRPEHPCTRVGPDTRCPNPWGSAARRVRPGVRAWSRASSVVRSDPAASRVPSPGPGKFKCPPGRPPDRSVRPDPGARERVLQEGTPPGRRGDPSRCGRAGYDPCRCCRSRRGSGAAFQSPSRVGRRGWP